LAARKSRPASRVSTLMGVERKLATVLFVDLVDSTGLVSTTDPEIVRRRVDRFFEQASQCIERHGGLVEKFAGDAVMAIFGVPQAHEDDAERAVRAALGILEATGDLGLEARVGVEAGEVVVGDGDSTFATGEAINLAARLQQHAGPGQILVGPSAYRLTLDRVEVEDVGPVEVRGRKEPLWAWRALRAYDGGPRALSLEAPLVGRDDELSMLENTYARVVKNKRAHLVTIFGEPGVGKSRLAREFLETLEGTTVLRGRCLPYGEGITYWPLAEMVKISAGIHDDEPVRQAFDKLRACCEDEAIADLLANASGVLEAVEAEATGQEIAWAAREWAGRLAEPQPLVLVFEDIHWSEEPLLELVEHLAEHVRDAPLLILCLARPELLEVRPSWGGGRLRSAAIELEPLDPDDARELIAALVANTSLKDECREDILDTTEGNPLFVEETVRLLVENDGSFSIASSIPNTLQALIAARIDRLPAGEKRLVQRAALIGRIFWEGSLAHLSPELDDITPLLESLVLRELVLPESRSTISGERAYKFKHVLIREVAYGGLSKSARAAQHARFAGWLKERAGDELLEIRAFHLDKAAYLLAELDGQPPSELAVEAAASLEAAGRRALGREAFRTARKLVLRSLELEPTLDRRWLAARAADRLGDMPAVAAEMETVRELAAAQGVKKLEAVALASLAQVALFTQADLPRAKELATQALDILPDDAPVGARIEVLNVRVQIAGWIGDHETAEMYLRKVLEAAQEAGRKDLEASAIQVLASLYITKLDLPAARKLVERGLELAEASGGALVRAAVLERCGSLSLVEGDYQSAEESFTQALELNREVGHVAGTAWGLKHLGTLAWKRGDLDQAQEHYREAAGILKKLGDRAYLCEVQRSLAELLVDAGRVDEAERFALEARETVGPQDALSQITTTFALGVVRAAQSRDEEAEQLLGSALERAESGPFRLIEREALERYARFLRDRGRDDEAAPLEERLAQDPLVAAA
jgi:class 3 adenylate cyclase/tetratricopeptide (TPR) repeat protein